MSRLDELILELCPNGVEYKQLKDLGVFYGGLTGKSKDDFENGNKIFITYKNVYSNPSLDLHPAERVKIGETENQRTLKYGDVIFTGSSETPDECGISSVVTEIPQDDLYLNSFCFIFRFDDLNGIYPPFMKHLFRSSSIRKQIGRTANGVTRYNVSKKLMAKISIPIPPMEVQKEIVRLLDDFTAKTEELQAELNKEFEARKIQEQYYFKQIFSMYNAPIVKLGDIGRVKMCKRILKAQTSSQGEIPFFKIGTFGKSADAFISKELYEEYIQKYSHPSKGDILISCAGTIGRTVVYDGNPAYFQDSNIVWLEHDNSQITNEYLRYVYKTNPWEISTGGTISRLYNDGIINAQIHLPTIEQQCKIVNMLDNFEKLCEELQSKISSELESRQKQYEYYRDKLLTFKELNKSEVN